MDRAYHDLSPNKGCWVIYLLLTTNSVIWPLLNTVRFQAQPELEAADSGPAQHLPKEGEERTSLSHTAREG